MHVSRGGQRVIQIPDDLIDGLVLFAGDQPQGPAVVRMRRESQGLK
jgi:hypothetical protein